MLSSLHTPSSPYTRQPVSVWSHMRDVMLALAPGLAAYVWFFGWGIVIQCILASLTALACESGMLLLRRRRLRPYLADGSALLSGILLALCLPSLAPWWITVLGSAFAIVVVKQLYGGLGHNPFNPAMAGYVFLLVSFPVEMTAWPLPRELVATPPGLVDSLALVFGAAAGPDAMSGATPLDTLKTGLSMQQSVQQVRAGPVFGMFSGKGWEWLALAWLAGGLWLLYRRVISWHIPAGLVGTVFALALLFYLLDPYRYATPLFHLFGGATIIGAFFIATDPVTAPASRKGRLLFGMGVGMLIYVIRTWGGYPDAVAFSVLLMNIAAPTIDRYTRPRVFGRDA